MCVEQAVIFLTATTFNEKIREFALIRGSRNNACDEGIKFLLVFFFCILAQILL
jgi:hypothetical protein